MRRLNLLFSLLLIWNSSYGQCDTLRYLVRSPNVSRRRYNAYLATDPASMAIARGFQNHPVDAHALQCLRRQFERAQLRYLHAQDPQMHAAWLDLVSFAYKADWPKPYRKMISIGFMRLAQSSISTTETERWLSLAANYDGQYKPDHNLFPPPLVAQFEQIRAESAKLRLPTKHFHGFQWVFVNGTPIRLADKTSINIPDQTVRLTFISSRYRPVTRVLPARVALRFSPQRVPWVSGTCKSPLWSSYPTSSHVKLAALFADSCVAVRGQTYPIYPLGSPKAKVALTDSPSSSLASNWGAPSITSEIPKLSSNSVPFYKRGWFWIAAGAVAGAIVYSRYQTSIANSGPPTTTHTSGF